MLARADEWWAWMMIDAWRQPPWSGGVFFVNRLDFEDGDIVQMLSPRVKYEAASWLDLGLNLSFLDIEKTTTGEHYLQFRPELEVDPKFDLTPHLRLDWRNRMEWRMNEGDTFTTHRLRHRLQLGWTLPKPAGPLTRIFASNEWLIDLHKQDWTENRLVPVGLTFKLTEHSDLDVFYMLDSVKNAGGWKDESIVGTYLHVRL